MKFTSVEDRRHVYRVDEVKPEHQGVYKVVAKNKTSTEESIVNVNITGESFVRIGFLFQDESAISHVNILSSQKRSELCLVLIQISHGTRELVSGMCFSAYPEEFEFSDRFRKCS